MNNWSNKISGELKDSPVGMKLDEVLEEYHDILNEFVVWVAGQSVDGNIIIANADTLDDGYHLYVQYKEYDTNKTFHFSVLNGGNLVLLEVNTPVDEANEVEQIETHEFGYQENNDGSNESYYRYHNFIENTLLKGYSVVYDKDGMKLETENKNIIDEEHGYSYQR